MLLMGVVKKTSRVDSYWTTDEVSDIPFFGKHMSYNRYYLLYNNFRLVNNETAVTAPTAPGFDVMYKLRPLLITHLRDTFAETYTPERDIAVDEATCPCKGRVTFRVFNPAKPDRFRIKLFEVCESSSGYCSMFAVYCGHTDVSTVAEQFGHTWELLGDHKNSTGSCLPARAPWQEPPRVYGQLLLFSGVIGAVGTEWYLRMRNIEIKSSRESPMCERNKTTEGISVCVEKKMSCSRSQVAPHAWCENVDYHPSTNSKGVGKDRKNCSHQTNLCFGLCV